MDYVDDGPEDARLGNTCRVAMSAVRLIAAAIPARIGACPGPRAGVHTLLQNNAFPTRNLPAPSNKMKA